MQIRSSKGGPSFNKKHVGDMFPCERDVSASEKKTKIPRNEFLLFPTFICICFGHIARKLRCNNIFHIHIHQSHHKRSHLLLTN